MFFDGVTYAAVSRNLAEGFGDIWHPYYTDIVYPEFYEQPPLFFFFQSVFYRIFGDSLIVEAFYGFASGLLILYFISKIWKLNFANSNNTSGVWVPILLFTVIPLTSWLFANNMLEGTMTLFTTIAVYLIIIGLNSTEFKSAAVLSVCSGVIIFISVMIKGPVGLFPLFIPFIWFALFERKKFFTSLLFLILMITGILLPFILLAVTSDAFLLSLSKYYNQQIVASVSGSREKGSSNFGILTVVMREVIVPIIIAIFVWIGGNARQKKKIIPEFNGKFWFYLLVAISGSFPIMLSPKQMAWYIFPSFPFYCLAIASLFDNSFSALESGLTKSYKRRMIVFTVSLFLFLSAITWMFLETGVVRKQKEFHNDFSVQKIEIPERTLISVYPPELKFDWSLVANMQRQFKVSLTDSIGCSYLLTRITDRNHIDSLNFYEKIHPPNPNYYVLYKHR